MQFIKLLLLYSSVPGDTVPLIDPKWPNYPIKGIIFIEGGKILNKN